LDILEEPVGYLRYLASGGAFSIFAEILMVKNQTNGFPRRDRVKNKNNEKATGCCKNK
jgi:hypothetical protein